MKQSKAAPGGARIEGEVSPAEPEQRGRFAADQLRDRGLEQLDELGAEPQTTPSDPPPQARTLLELELDATALARAAFLLMIFARVRRGRAGRAEVADKRARVDARAQRVGGRVGPRLAILGGALFWAGVVGELGSEVLEELIDRELDAQAERAVELEAQAQHQTRQDGQP